MGLAISVGFLADMNKYDEEGADWARSMFAATNAFLAAEGEQGWDEPEEVDVSMRPHVSSFPYSFIHYLRRAYAITVRRPETLAPTNGELTEADDLVIADEGSMFSSHLLCHSDCEGLYVPIDFKWPLFGDDAQVPGGGMLGSSQGLLRELREVAPGLGIALDPDLSDAEAERLYNVEDTDPWFREYIVFLTLWAACQASIKHNTAIVFT